MAFDCVVKVESCFGLIYCEIVFGEADDVGLYVGHIVQYLFELFIVAVCADSVDVDEI